MISSDVLKLCLNFNLIHDVNHCIKMLTHVTTDFESEELSLCNSIVFLSPNDLLKIITLIYHQVLKKLNEKDINIQ